MRAKTEKFTLIYTFEIVWFERVWEDFGKCRMKWEIWSHSPTYCCPIAFYNCPATMGELLLLRGRVCISNMFNIGVLHEISPSLGV